MIGNSSFLMNKDVSILGKVFDNLQEGIVVADLEGNFILFNQVAEKILGLGSVDVPPQEWVSIYGCYKPDMETQYQVEELPMLQALGGIKVVDEVMFIRNPAQSLGVWINISANPIKDDQGKIIGGAIFFRDIPHHVKPLEKMPGPEAKFFENGGQNTKQGSDPIFKNYLEFGSRYNLLVSAVQETGDSIVITDSHGSIIYVNSGFENKTGYPSVDVLGKNPRILKSGKHDQDFYNSLWKKIKSGQHFRGTILNKKKNGDLFWSEQTITPIKNDQGDITNYVSVLKDITDLIERQRLEREIELAAEIQLNVIPETLPSIPGINVGARLKPARTVSGDFFDIIHLSDSKVGVLIGDVIDKGMPAAILMARVHALIASGAGRVDQPKDLLLDVNKHLSHFKASLQFVTVLYGVLDYQAMSFSYARAGHEPPLLLSPDGKVKLMGHQLGMVLGMYDKVILDEQSIQLEPGSSLLLYTDGVVDCQDQDGNTFGINRIKETLVNGKNLDAQGICDSILLSLEDFQQNEPQYDDIALVALQVEP